MNRIDSEFAFQARELAEQIEGILGDPPNHKNYRMVVDALLKEFAKGSFVDDVNLLSFTLVDKIQFTDLPGLLASAKQYESADAAQVVGMATFQDTAFTEMLAAVFKSHPELVRQAIIVACLHKNRNLWLPDEAPLDADDENDSDDIDDVDYDGSSSPSADMIGLFDEVGDANEK